MLGHSGAWETRPFAGRDASDAAGFWPGGGRSSEGRERGRPLSAREQRLVGKFPSRPHPDPPLRPLIRAGPGVEEGEAPPHAGNPAGRGGGALGFAPAPPARSPLRPYQTEP